MQDTPYTHLDIVQWAWEFLRRNPEYQADYQEFIATWRALEAQYGAPPNRDFFHWQQDSRASRPSWDPSRSTGATCTTDDEDQQLIECWMGVKWGFYQFPKDPARPAWDLDAPINWRPPPAFELHDLDSGSEDISPTRHTLNFDLSLPLPAQLDAARRWLVSEQIRLRKQGLPAPRTLESQRAHWQKLIGALENSDYAHTLWKEAEQMTRQGYRKMLLLQIKPQPD